MNDLTLTSSSSFEDIAKIIGQDESSGSSTPAIYYLKINRDHEDDSGRSIPAGSWTTELDGNKVVYAKEIDFQVFAQRYQYLHYDAEANEMVSRSVFANNLYPQTEIPDTVGTFRCGSVPASQREGLPADKALLQKNIKCFRMLFGKVTFVDGVDSDGNSIEVKDVPVLWRARGSNFMPISVPIDSLSAQKKPFIFYKLRGSLEKKKNGGLVYYVGGFKVNDGPVDFTDEDQGTLAFFMDYISSENKKVMALYDETLRKQGKVVDQDPVNISVDDALNDDLSAVEA